MKGKGNWRRWFSTALIMALLSSLPGSAFGAEKPEWRYGESILVEVKVNESKTFSPEDFPVIDCKKVFVLEKRTREDGVEYQLVLIPDASKKTTTLKEDIEKLLTLPIVTHAERNHVLVTPQEFFLTLNHTCLYLAVDEVADVTIEDCYLYDEDRIFGFGFEPDSAYFDMDSLRKDSFLEYGITSFWPEIQGQLSLIIRPESRPEELEAQKSENGYYYGIAGNANEHIFEVLNNMAAAPQFPFVSIVKMWRVGENSCFKSTSAKGIHLMKSRPDSEKRFDESWHMENTDIAAYTLSGGTNANLWDNSIWKTATVRGLKAGITKIICEESKYDSHVASGCTVIVYEPGGKNNPGDMDHDGVVSTDDVLQVLKHSVGLISLDETVKRTADLNQDNFVDEKDALLMLKITAGIL